MPITITYEQSGYLFKSKQGGIFRSFLGGGLAEDRWCKYIITSKRKEKMLQCVFMPFQDLSMFCSVLPCYLQENSVCVQSFPYFFSSSQCWFSVVLYSTSISAFIISSSSAPGHGNHAFIFESKSGMNFLICNIFA